jgi:hypothetical protein
LPGQPWNLQSVVTATLASSGVIREQKADSGLFEQVVINRLKLMREGIDAGDRKAEVRIEFEGNAKRIGLDAEPQEVAFPTESACWLLYCEGFEVGGGEGDATELLSSRADQAKPPSAITEQRDGFDTHGLVE